MARKKKILSPTYTELIVPTYEAIKEMGNSATNNEIYNKIIENLHLSDKIVDEPHGENSNIGELAYQLAWARTYLKNYGVIINSKRGVWSISQQFRGNIQLNKTEVVAYTSLKKHKNNKDQIEPINNEIIMDSPDEVAPWRKKIMDILLNMDPFAFERLSQRLLRECGFTEVKVTQKTGDGGIDGTGKLKINGVFSFNVAFQCKRYKGLISPSVVQAFRGSLPKNIEKGILITTGTFSKKAKEEAANPSRQQIDLMDGEEFVNKLAEYEIGVKPVIDYEIDNNFFENI